MRAFGVTAAPEPEPTEETQPTGVKAKRPAGDPAFPGHPSEPGTGDEPWPEGDPCYPLTMPKPNPPHAKPGDAIQHDYILCLECGKKFKTLNRHTAQHSGIPPGYKDDDVSTTPARDYFYNQLVRDGRYMMKIPKNPFNDLDTIQIIGNLATFPDNASGPIGWQYQPATKSEKQR